MKIRNPGAGSPVTGTDRADFQAILDSFAGQATVTFEEIRAALPAGKRARATDGLIHAVALELGATVEIG